MKQRATVTSKGQITIPAQVRRALDLHAGDQVVFEVDGAGGHNRASLRRASDIFAMAGSIPPRRPVPPAWQEERKLAREELARRRHR